MQTQDPREIELTVPFATLIHSVQGHTLCYSCLTTIEKELKLTAEDIKSVLVG
jgi:hypothetical protein